MEVPRSWAVSSSFCCLKPQDGGRISFDSWFEVAFCQGIWKQEHQIACSCLSGLKERPREG